MVIVYVDGRREEVERGGGMVTVGEIEKVLGKGWRIDCICKVDGARCVLCVGVGGDVENTVASLLVGRIVWGTALFLKCGSEIRG
jgi:hypothetical protein